MGEVGGHGVHAPPNAGEIGNSNERESLAVIAGHRLGGCRQLG
ncbi:unnamed protein product [Penicillium roqueforti FM164]|uniref:Genomic scaffold, ProqFM164S01 n=1 Tax=Penicillium roqueforti (strain FM164) TaxID=1365484 RepID=W6PY81_PENRF|nr:unnamed protein product [Penicillium roqueforti FM164]